MAITDKVKNWITKDILDDVYPPGSKMPTRMELMEKYRIARASADKVIRELVKEGVLYSIQGSGTYVTDHVNNAPHVYIVLNTDVECLEISQTFHTQLYSMLEDFPEHLDYSIIGSKDFEKYYSRILQNNNCRVIWNRPSIRAYSYIAALDRSRIAQVLINRPLPAWNNLSTDTRLALQKTFDYIKTKHRHPRLGLIVPQLNPDEPFLAEREVYFHEMAYKFQGHMNFIERASSSSPDSIMNVIRKAIEQLDQLDYLFVPDYSMVPFVIALLSERKIKLGKDITLITMDWNDIQEGTICIKQDWHSMFDQALTWAQSTHIEPIQKLICPQILY